MGISAIASSINNFAAPPTRLQANKRPSTTNSASASSISISSSTSGTDSKSNTENDGKPLKIKDTTKLSDDTLAQIGKLKARDTEVRQHEAAHLAAAGGLATSGASYTYQKGPDGVSYAIGGEVSIDISPGRTPQETIERARIIQAAALAPAEPSGPDLAVAAQAQQLEQEAHGELARQQSEPSESTKDQSKNVNRAYGIGDDNSANSRSLSIYA
jgi:hypothetical protein